MILTEGKSLQHSFQTLDRQSRMVKTNAGHLQKELWLKIINENPMQVFNIKYNQSASVTERDLKKKLS